MSQFLQDISNFIKEKNYPIYAVAEIKDGGEAEHLQIIPGNPCQNSYSVAKVFVVTAIGLLYDKGLLSTDDLVVELLADEISADTREKMDDGWNTVTLDMALRHRLALPSGFLDIDSGDPRRFGTDYLSYMLTYPLTGEHGKESCYTDGAYYLLARIAEKLSGERLDTFLWRELFSKLGFHEVAWSCCPMGHCMGATGLYIYTEDAVKLGELYMNGGCFGGKRILSEEWVSTVFTRDYELHKSGFGEGYCKRGMRGQMLAIFPKQNRAVAWHAYGFGAYNELMYFISQYEN